MLNKQWMAAKTSQEKGMIEYQIVAIDQQVNQLVYRLHGLTSDEVTMIEC